MTNDDKRPPTVAPGDDPDVIDVDVPESQRQDSPDYLAAPKRGKGVRRLNKVPMLVVGGLLLLTVMGVSYTFYQRQQAQLARATAPVEAPPLPASATAPIKPGDGPDLIAGPPAPPTTEMPLGELPATGGQPPQTMGGAPMAVEPSEAYRRRLEQIQRVEERRLAQMEAALGAEGPVATFKEARQGGAQPGMAGLPGMAGMAAPAVPSAGDEMQRYLAAMQAGGGAMGGQGGSDGGMGGDMAALNRQPQKQAFLAGTPDAETYLAAQRKAAVAMSQEVKAGTVIPGVMISGLNSDLPGQIIAQVRENVYDSATGTQLLIPAGSRLVGTYDSGITLGQKRALVGWNRIIYPDSSSISLGTMPGADLSGYAGFRDKVDNHYARIFGSGLMLSLFSAGIQLSQPESNGSQYDARQIIAAELGREMGQLGMEMTRRNMSIQPTIEVRPGYTFNVMVTKDIILPTWHGHPMAR